jgi:pyruvate formate lyase activating enzyme
MTPSELLEEVLKYKNFIAKGGVTATGGEPLLQAEFLKEFFKLCKKEGIHTALDTSGFIYTPKTLEVLDDTDLVLLDIKSINPEIHQKLTGVKLDNTIRFLDYLEEKGIDTWIRHVIVPGYTDDESQLKALAEFVNKYSVIKKMEILPYHTMGIEKYKQLGMDYPLKDTKALAPEKLAQAKKIFNI